MTKDEAVALLWRVSEDPAFAFCSDEGAATMDILISPAEQLRQRAASLEKRDALIRDLRQALVGDRQAKITFST